MSLKNLNAKRKNHKFLKSKLYKKRIKQIYKKFEKSLNIQNNFAVAVSGGPDSLALAFLAKIYSIEKKINSQFFIVDHKLRPESTNEAKNVKKLLKKISIDAKILSWKGQKPLKNIQSLARAKRYELLFKQMDKFKITCLLLGHHSDDLIENFFIRILRGSGLKGLTSLDKKTKIRDKNLLRPLLYEKKENLVFIAKTVFNFFVEDSSNKDEKYLRIKVRKLILELQKNGFSKSKLFLTLRNLKDSDEVVNFYVNQSLAKNTKISYDRNRLILSEEFFKQPHEIIFRSLSNSISLIGKRYYPVRGKKLDSIVKAINSGKSIKMTLGGCIIEKVNQTVIISREP